MELVRTQSFQLTVESAYVDALMSLLDQARYEGKAEVTMDDGMTIKVVVPKS